MLLGVAGPWGRACKAIGQQCWDGMAWDGMAWDGAEPAGPQTSTVLGWGGQSLQDHELCQDTVPGFQVATLPTAVPR